MQILQRQAYNNHFAIASMKLIQYDFAREDKESAMKELLRFRNMYGNDTPVMAWAHADMTSTYCDAGPLARTDRCILAQRWAR